MDISNRIDLPKTNELTKKKKIQPVIGLALFIAVVVFGIIKGNVETEDPVLVRVHSSCATGDIFGSLRCDCGEQLHKALRMIEKDY